MTTSNNPYLTKKILFTGKIKLLTGLRIGGTSSAMSIGGLDNIIIRNPIDNKPYIPGSSLKGKMRALIEVRDGTISYNKGKQIEYGVSDDITSLSSRLFGFSSKDKNLPSAIIVRDCNLVSSEDTFKNTDVPYAEVKTEVTIDRITSKANPRIMERVPAGAIFELNIVLNIMSTHTESQEKELVKTVYEALELVQDDYLGGSGSRGYGQVEFYIDKVVEKTRDYYKNTSENKQETVYTLVPVPNGLKKVR